jgi:hypothetical protein
MKARSVPASRSGSASRSLAALLDRFLPLEHHLARRYQRAEDLDDLQQVAAIGLLNAIDRFDPGRGPAFSSFRSRPSGANGSRSRMPGSPAPMVLDAPLFAALARMGRAHVQALLLVA